MTQMLIYKKATPVSFQNHSKLCIERKNFDFAAQVNSVPLVCTEIPVAASGYPIVFAGKPGDLLPVVVLGLESGKNYYVGPDGNWEADYIPAFIRRYPFVFARDGEKFALCLDEDWSGCNRDGRGQALFTEDGRNSDYLAKMLNFLDVYREHFARTQAFGKILAELDLLVPMQATFKLPSGDSQALGGFCVVDRPRLKELPPDSLASLVRQDALELIYLHLFSLKNIQQLVGRA